MILAQGRASPLFFYIKNPEPVEIQGCADGGTRTRTLLKAGDFKSPVSAIPPHPQLMKNITCSFQNVKEGILKRNVAMLYLSLIFIGSLIVQR